MQSRGLHVPVIAYKCLQLSNKAIARVVRHGVHCCRRCGEEEATSSSSISLIIRVQESEDKKENMIDDNKKIIHHIYIIIKKIKTRNAVEGSLISRGKKREPGVEQSKSHIVQIIVVSKGGKQRRYARGLKNACTENISRAS